MNNGKINWFGEEKNKSINKLNSNSINFFGTGKPQKNLKRNIPQNVNFLGLKTKKLNNYKMIPSPLFRKESIRTNKRKLSKWGDADLDGSPNYFDCDPRNAFKDAKLTKAQKAEITREDTLLYNTEQKIKAEKSTKRKERIEKVKNVLGKIKKRVLEGKQYSNILEKAEKTREESIGGAKKQLKEFRGALKKGKISVKGYEKERAPIVEQVAKDETIKTKITSVKGRTEELKKMLKVPGLQGKKEYARYIVEEKIARGKKPTKKETAALAKAEKKIQKFGDIQQEGRISREILTAAPGGQVIRALTGAGVVKGGEYSKALKAKSARVRRMTEFATGAIFGNLTQPKYRDNEPRGRGRPPGPSGEYKIGGKPVYEEAFQQYTIKQNALNKLLPSEAQSASLNPEYIAYMKAKAAAEQIGLGEGQTQNQSLNQQTEFTEEGEAIPAEGTDMPGTGSSMMQTGQQQEMIKQERGYTRALPSEIKQAQQQAQQRDNILKAPNFMRGELKATGGSILTPIGPSILEAPRVFSGEMRNVTSTQNKPVVKLGERPQTNPYGSEWLDVEIGSGKPVIRKRISEKWATGEAL